MPVDTCSTSREMTGQLFLLGLLIVALLGTLYSRAGEGGSPLILPLLPISSVCVVSWHLFSLLHLHALSQWEVTSLCACLAWRYHSFMFSSLYFLLHRQLNPTSFLFSLCPVFFSLFLTWEWMRYVCSGLCAQIWTCGWRPEADNRLIYSPFHLLRQSLSLESRAHQLSGWSYPPPELVCHVTPTCH